MPTPERILAGLYAISNEARALAVAWHVLALLALAAVIAGWRPSRRTVGAALALPLASVATMAWTHGNPFNGLMFTALAIAVGLLGVRLPAAPAARAPRWAVSLGLAMVAFGLVYPHFVDVTSWWTYVYAAPTGLVPCPTLSVVIGVALAVDGLGSKPWALVLAGAGLFYGVFGMARLGVTLDLGLLVGSTALLARGLSRDLRGHAMPTTADT